MMPFILQTIIARATAAAEPDAPPTPLRPSAWGWARAPDGLGRMVADLSI